MKQRCYNPNDTSYQNYGSRGIRVCIRWRDNPKAFYNWAMAHGWKEGLTIDRKDNNGNYHPDNCRFVTRQENNNNKREYKACKIPSNNTTGYKGVGIDKRAKVNKYRARCTIDGNQKYLGCFNTVEEAAKAIQKEIS